MKLEQKIVSGTFLNFKWNDFHSAKIHFTLGFNCQLVPIVSVCSLNVLSCSQNCVVCLVIANSRMNIHSKQPSPEFVTLFFLVFLFPCKCQVQDDKINNECEWQQKKEKPSAIYIWHKMKWCNSICVVNKLY